MKKHSKTINNILFILVAAVLTGCGRESPRTDYVARVNNTYLTEEELERIIDSTPGNKFYRNEIIRNWINKEVLYQKADDEGILKDKEYKRILNKSGKELAAAMLLDQIYNDKEVSVSDNELTEFYNLNKEEFRLNTDHYLLNSAKFHSEDYAVTFRSMVIESNWEEAVEDFSESYSFVDKKSSHFTGEREIHPVSLLRVIKELYPGETSIVINEGSESFAIVQMLQKYTQGTIPAQPLIKETLKKRLVKNKKEEFIKSYIKELYSDFEIEIRQN